jgi:uncharacterized heparinase superfamily protein
MKGAFLWGRRANSYINECKLNTNNEVISVWHDGYAPIIHERKISFSKSNKFTVNDYLKGKSFHWCFTLMLHPETSITEITNNKVILTTSNNDKLFLKTDDGNEFLQEDVFISETYGSKVPSKAIRIRGYSADNKALTINIGINTEV